MPSALIFIANGTEEMEFTIAYDTLIRGGAQCTSVFVGEESSQSAEDGHQTVVTCSRGVKIIPDAKLQDIKQETLYDLLVIPGGAKGAETISNHTEIQKLIRRHYEGKKWVGMICAGSVAALKSGLPRQPLTSHPSVKSSLDPHFDYSEEPVVVSGNLITSRGPGTAFPFSLCLVECVMGTEKKKEVEGPMVFPSGSI